VLPGAFSLLRWKAVKGRPIEEFLKGLNKRNLNLLELNMFLAEDRIMCFQIIS
jgi:chitin synthase